MADASHRREFDLSPEEDLKDEEWGPLVERLRNLTWPEVPPHVRERSLQRLRELGALDGQRDAGAERAARGRARQARERGCVQLARERARRS